MAMVFGETAAEMAGSDRLPGVGGGEEQAGGGGGAGEGRRPHLPLHWNRWVGVVSRSRSAMGSGLLQRAMPGSL